MMDLLHPIRLRWSSCQGSGVMRCDEVELRLRRRPPVLLHVEHLEEIDFAPGIFAPYVQPRGEPRRDMDGQEIDECSRYVRAWAASCRGLAEAAVERTKPPGDQPGGPLRSRPGSTVTPKLLDGEPSGPE